MYTHRRIIMAIVFAFFGNSVLLAAPKQDQAIPQQRSMRYISRSADDAKAWQEDVRARLFLLLKMDNSLQRRNSIPFSANELSRADRGTYHIMEVEINSTSSRRIRVVVTIPSSKAKPVPAVVCIGGHGSDLYSPYDPKTIAVQGPKKKQIAYIRDSALF